jgi:hypothetical protein
MAVTYTAAIERDARSARDAARHAGREDVLLLATSLVALLAIGLSYAGRSHAFERTPAPVTNLNTVETAEQLEAPLDRVL